MTYLSFHAVFLLPAIAILFFALPAEFKTPRSWRGIGAICLIALVYTTPWDNYLVARGVWYYQPGRVIEALKIGYVPFEEYLFFILQPILTSLVVLLLAAGFNSDWQALLGETKRRRGPRLIAGSGYLVLALIGVALLGAGENFVYLALIMVWAFPVLAFQGFYGADILCRAPTLWALGVLAPSMYLWIADRWAIDQEVWTIAAETSTGWMLFSLPFEEALFFVVTNLLVVQGVLLYWEWEVKRQSRRAQSFGTAAG